jgi:hypothetical protein
MSKQLNNAINILFVVLVLLALGWVWGVISNWNEIVSRPVRLAYIICDFLIVMPLGFVSGWGLKNGKPWAKTLFPLALGALLFDIAHGIFYLIWDNYFGVPLFLAFVLLIVFIGYVVYAMRALNSA